VCALLLLLLLSTVAVCSGLHEVWHQRATIERLAALHAQDVAAVAKQYAGEPNAGNAAYFTFYNTWDAPGNAAFLALGMRDVAPYVLRVRALGLQSQIHEGETFNPELALPGRFDFAFVLIYLAPLFAIALLHDVIAGERHAGRLRLLMSLPGAQHLWWRRVALRYALILACLLLPALAGAIIEGTALATVALVLLLATSTLAFWCGLCLWVAARGWRTVASATALMAGWTVLTLVLPALANVAMTRAIPIHQGVDLTLAQREAVHGAWEIPREATMEKFFASHPKWQDTAPLPEEFHWKWYFAFHQLGDESVAEQAQAYRDGLLARQTWSNRLGWLLPGVAAQSVRQIRAFYYGYLFHDRPFGHEDFARRPVFQPAPANSTLPAPNTSLWILAALSWGILLAGLLATTGGQLSRRGEK